MTIAVANAAKIKYDLTVNLKGANLSGKGHRWLIAGNNEMDYNEPGKAPQVRIMEETVENFCGQLEVPALSITLYRLAKKSGKQ